MILLYTLVQKPVEKSIPVQQSFLHPGEYDCPQNVAYVVASVDFDVIFDKNQVGFALAETSARTMTSVGFWVCEKIRLFLLPSEDSEDSLSFCWRCEPIQRLKKKKAHFCKNRWSQIVVENQEIWYK